MATALTAQRDELLAALREYGGHLENCFSAINCDCGFTAARAKLSANHVLGDKAGGASDAKLREALKPWANIDMTRINIPQQELTANGFPEHIGTVILQARAALGSE